MQFNEYTLETQPLIQNQSTQTKCGRLICTAISASILLIGVGITVIFILL